MTSLVTLVTVDALPVVFVLSVIVTVLTELWLETAAPLEAIGLTWLRRYNRVAGSIAIIVVFVMLA